MRIYNTQTRVKEEFVPREEGSIAMYVCGPTVYNHVHIGNVRTFLSFDTIRRYLIWRGYDVRFVSNITDVDDKIINRAAEEGVSAQEVAEEYTKAFIDVMHAMNVLDPTVRPKATEEIDTMIALVETLIEKGHAYERDGSVYFSVRSFPDYGKLSGRDVDEMRSGSREQRGGDFTEEKDDPLDFALWKAAKPGEPAWDSPWGKGRPGWHIECSAMSGKYLGLPLDIHGGGSDLVFPHHENEVAQSEAAYDTTFANYWMHGGMLLIDKEKMSKSLGNFLLAKDVIAAYDPAAVRLLMLQTHYRSPLDYSKERLEDAVTSLDRISTSLRNIDWALSHADASAQPADEASSAELAQGLIEACATTRASFIEAMDDDFNTAGGLGAIFTLVGQTNTVLSDYEATSAPDESKALREAADVIRELLDVFGIDTQGEPESEIPKEVIELSRELVGYAGTDGQEAARALIEGRAAARARKDWGSADAIRDGLTELGFTIEDTPAGARISFSG